MFIALTVVACIIIQMMMHNVWVTTLIGILCIAALVILYFIRPEIYDNLMVNVLGTVSIATRYDNFSLGIFDIGALIYYLSISFLFVFLTIQKVRKQRWS